MTTLRWSMSSSCSELFCRKSSILTYPTCVWRLRNLRVIPVEFCRDIRHKKTRVPGVSCGVVYMILRLAVSVEHRLVTDRQTDRHTTATYTTLASCVKNRSTFVRVMIRSHVSCFWDSVFFQPWHYQRYMFVCELGQVKASHDIPQ